MTLDSTFSGTDSDPDQKLLAANSLTLAHIARGAPLVQTLTCILNGIEGQHQEISGAILLWDEDENRLTLGAAPGLPQDYCLAVDGIAADAGVWAHPPATDTTIQATGENIPENPFWCRFRDLALQQGLYPCMTVPIRSAGNVVLGVFIAYSKEPDRAIAELRPVIVDALTLASIAIERDIDTARIKKLEGTLRDSETRMALAIDRSGTGIWDRNVTTGEIHYSPGWKAILGYADSEITHRIEDSYPRVHPDDLGFVKTAMQDHFDQKTDTYSVEHRIRCKDGSYKWISSRGQVVARDSEGKALRMLGTTTDITAMRALSDRLQQSVDLITTLTNGVPGFVYQYQVSPTGDAFFLYASEGIREIYEITPEQVAREASLVDGRVHPDDLADYRASLDASAASLTPWHLVYRVVLPRQGVRWRNGDAQPRRLDDGSMLWQGFISDLTERMRVESELHEFATIDFLTQLPNRRRFMARMEEELGRLEHVAGKCSAVLMCDLDHFKLTNDTYGHAVGDLVLEHFANVLRKGLRVTDTVGRIGGEEFAVLLSGVGSDEANIFAKRVQKRLAETPLIVRDRAIPLTVSIGIATMGLTDASAAASLARSDMALYRAKNSGRDRVEITID